MLLPGAEEPSGQQQGEIPFPGVYLGGLRGAGCCGEGEGWGDAAGSSPRCSMQSGALLVPCVGDTCSDFLSPLPLGPGTGGGWKGELQPRARRDVCPQGSYPRDCCNPGSLFPINMELCSWLDWL